jgi:hypothetical protein
VSIVASNAIESASGVGGPRLQGLFGPETQGRTRLGANLLAFGNEQGALMGDEEDVR